MADEEAEREHSPRIGSSAAIAALRDRLQELAGGLKDSREPAVQSTSQYCQDFCQTLVEYAGRWKISEDPLPLVEVYTVAILNYAQARRFLTSEYENVSLVLERLTLNCVELLLSLPEEIPDALWQVFQCSVQTAHSLQLENGCSELQMLSAIAKDTGVWANSTLRSILSKETSEMERVHEFLEQEGPVLLDMRIKQLIKASHIEKAALLAKVCSEHPEFGGKSNFKQTYLVCLCTAAPQEQLMLEISEVDCKDALEMICNLESEGDERGALSLCSAFLTRQLLQGEMYCAWELTLFWSKLLHRLEASTQVFLDHCRRISLMSKTVYHIFFLIKVIQSEVEDVGLPVCIELCVRALRMESSDNANIKATICKTISCLLPNDLEVKRACQLTEFLLEPTVDSYYAVETLYNEPDQKFEEENLPVPNSLRCELLLVFKTQWPFDPEFWDWKTLKRHCLALMGEEASIVSSIDELNDSEVLEQLEEEDGSRGQEDFKDLNDCFLDTTNVLNEIVDEKQKKREIKKLREKGFISARFRNWQAYMQYCVLCDKEFLGHRIVRHAQKHVKDGVYSCPICAENFDSKELFVPHVTSHVKQSCKERLAAMKTSRKLANPTKMPFPDSALHKEGAHEKQDCKPKKKSRPCSNDSPVSSHGDSPEGSRHKLPKPELAVHRAEYVEEYTCPVTNCRKGFKYFKNLVAHVKAHKNNEEAKRFLEMQSKKVVCQYCRRQFVSVTHLNDHLQMHCGSKPYICIQLNCRSSFLSNAELLVHRKEHVAFKAKCMFPNCGRIFYEAYMLYDHEAQHYNTFTCKAPNCGKIFHSQSQLDLHLEDHVVKQEPPANEDPDFIKTEQPDPKSPLQDPNHTVSPDSHPSNLLDFLQHETAEPSSSTSPDKTMLADHSRLQVENANRDMQDAAQDSMHESEQKLVVETNRMDTQKHEDTPAPHSSDPLLDISIQKPLAEPNQTVLEEFTQTLLPEPDHTSSQNLSRLQDPYRTILHDSHMSSFPDPQPALIPDISQLPNLNQNILQDQIQTEVSNPNQNLLCNSNQILYPNQDSLPTEIPSWFQGVNHTPHVNQTALQHPVQYNCPLGSHIKEEPVSGIDCMENVSNNFQQALSAQACDDGGLEVSSDGRQAGCPPLPELLLKSEAGQIKHSTPSATSCDVNQIPNRTPIMKVENPNEIQIPRPSQVASGVAVPNTNPVPPSVVGRVNAVPSQLYKGIAVVPGGDTTGNTEGLVKAVQRYNCSFESCTRTYSSTRSVSKHMKAVHPEYYAELKLARKNKTVPRTPNRAAPSDGNPLFLIPSQEKKVKTPMSQVQKTANTPLPFTVGSLSSSSSNAAFSSHAENAATQVLPTQIENIINPIILSQLGNAQIPANTLLPSQAEGSPSPSSHTGGSGKVLPLHLQALASQLLSSQMKKTTPALSTPICATNQTISTHSASVTPIMKTQGSLMNQTLTPQQLPSSVMLPSMPHREGKLLDSPRETSTKPALVSQLSSGPDSFTGPHFADGTNSVLSAHNNQHVLQTAHTENADQFLNCDSNLAAPVSGENSHLAYDSSLNNRGEPPQMNSVTKIALSQVDASNPNLPSNMENLTHPLLPSYLENLKVPALPDKIETAVNPLFLPQLESSSFPSFSSQVERIVNPQLQSSTNAVFPSQVVAVQSTPNASPTETMAVPKSENDALKVKRTKHNKRAKWPAIVKDGKFICCRCFREFPSPKSLGGHLSKRSHCIPFDEPDATPELRQDRVPVSFLADLINTSTLLNSHQQLLTNFNPNLPFKDQPSQSLGTGNHTDTRYFPNVIFPQANGSACDPNEVEQNGEILKQALENTGVPNLFDPSAMPQQTFQNPSASYHLDGRLPESTVIQHTGKIKKSESDCSGEDYSKAESAFCNDIFSDPLLSQMLAENNSQASLTNLALTTNHLNQMLRAETLLNKSKGSEEPQRNAGTPQQNILSNDRLLAAMANLSQNLVSNQLLQMTTPNSQQPLPTQGPPEDAAPIKKNVRKTLRDQILAADLLKSGKAGHVSHLSGVSAQSVLQQRSDFQNLTSVPQALDTHRSSHSSEMTQKAPNSEHKLEMNNNVMDSGSVSQGDAPGARTDNTHLSGEPSQENTTNDPGSGSATQSNDEKVAEILSALKRLDLNKESSEDSPPVDNCSPGNHLSSTAVTLNQVEAVKPHAIVTKDAQPVENLVKPFVCENEGCPYSAMTKDALFKHYSKVHNYTEDMMNEIRKNQLKFAPFRCQICNKTFTRNSNLRAHCQSVHCLSQEEMIRLKIKRPYSRKSEKGEVDLCKSRGMEEKMNPLCVESVPILNQMKPEYSVSQHCVMMDIKQEQMEVATAQHAFPIHRHVNGENSEYSRNAFTEQTAAGQAMPEFIAGNHLAMEQSTAEIPVAKQTMEGQPPLTLPMRGQPAEVKATVRLPGADQPLEGQPAIGLTGAVQYLAGQHAMSCLTPGASIVTPPATGFLPAAKTAGFPLPGNPSPEKLKKPKVSKPKVDKPKIEKPKKPKEKKEKKPVAKESESNEYSPYRPYRCVHQGCFAAFTIQQNLILHYRAVHQSDLPRFDHDNEEESDEVRDEMEDETSQIKEFRCQVKDCSRIFPEVTSLLQHYVQLHKFTLDEAGALMSNMNLGRFQCDQTDCTASFTAFWKYISHIEEEHENKVIKSEGPEGLFKCDCEGCDRVYATRSNLLRHLLKKHRESHKAHLIRPRKKLGQDGGSSYRRPPKKSKFSGLKMNNGKENVQNNKKPKFKYDKKKNSDRKRGIWITVEKPVLKTSAEAIAMCTKKFPMQFPCMIKGCVSVVSSERNIFRHYTTHSLSDQYIEEQRSDFILCKKRSRHHYKDKSSRNDGETEKAGETTSETSDNEDAVETCPEGSETESSKATSSKDEVESSDTKQSTDESSETMGKRKSRRRWAFTVTNMLVKNKRGRPLKKKRKDMIQAKQRRIPERLKAKLHNEANNTCSGSESTTSSSPALPQPDQPQQNIALSTFKPMGFEVSFLKFLEESAHTPKRRAKENHSEIPSKRQRTLQQKYGNIMCRKSEAHIRARDCQNLIDFRNPLNLKSVKNVKIVVDKTFSDGAELLLKQLQEMRPIVILKKWLYS
ncbi:zinc finger protein 292 [Amia ocellicauda]|uniref:zinc finger protein 292 n=1 Tax=Amia ocellicauda TaxID=2972642 RepID=UPI003464A3D7